MVNSYSENWAKRIASARKECNVLAEIDVYCELSNKFRENKDYLKAIATLELGLALCLKKSEHSSDFSSKSNQIVRIIDDCEIDYLKTRGVTNPIVTDFRKYREELKKQRTDIKAELERISLHEHSHLEQLYRKITCNVARIIKSLLQESLDALQLSEKLSSDFTVILLGSFSRDEGTPYSDLEYGYVWKKNEQDDRELLRQLTEYFHLKLIRLGETAPSMMDINELQVVFDVEDCPVGNGFTFDAQTQYSGNTPLGTCHLTEKSGNSYALMGTAQYYADLYRRAPNLDRHLSTLLLNARAACRFSFDKKCFIDLDTETDKKDSLFLEYKTELEAAIKQEKNVTISVREALDESLASYRLRFGEYHDQKHQYHIKFDFYRLPQLVMSQLARYRNQPFLSTVDLVDVLFPSSINSELREQIKKMIFQVKRLRLESHLRKDTQYERLITGEEKTKCSPSIIQEIYQVQIPLYFAALNFISRDDAKFEEVFSSETMLSPSDPLTQAIMLLNQNQLEHVGELLNQIEEIELSKQRADIFLQYRGIYLECFKSERLGDAIQHYRNAIVSAKHLNSKNTLELATYQIRLALALQKENPKKNRKEVENLLGEVKGVCQRNLGGNTHPQIRQLLVSIGDLSMSLGLDPSDSLSCFIELLQQGVATKDLAARLFNIETRRYFPEGKRRSDRIRTVLLKNENCVIQGCKQYDANRVAENFALQQFHQQNSIYKYFRKIDASRNGIALEAVPQEESQEERIKKQIKLLADTLKLGTDESAVISLLHRALDFLGKDLKSSEMILVLLSNIASAELLKKYTDIFKGIPRLHSLITVSNDVSCPEALTFPKYLPKTCVCSADSQEELVSAPSVGDADLLYDRTKKHLAFFTNWVVPICGNTNSQSTLVTHEQFYNAHSDLLKNGEHNDGKNYFEVNFSTIKCDESLMKKFKKRFKKYGLRAANFQYANLKGFKFDRVDLTEANFSYAEGYDPDTFKLADFKYLIAKYRKAKDKEKYHKIILTAKRCNNAKKRTDLQENAAQTSEVLTLLSNGPKFFSSLLSMLPTRSDIVIKNEDKTEEFNQKSPRSG